MVSARYVSSGRLRGEPVATPPLRLAIVGLGWVARDYMLPAIGQTAGVELVAVCDVAEPPAGLLPPRARHFADLAAMLAEVAPDAVYIATPNHLHVAQAATCLEAGVAVLCEKPIAPTAAEAARLASVVERTGVPYATAFDQRYHPAHVRLADLVRAGRIGTPTQVRLDYACWLPGDWSPDAAAGGAPAPDNWRVDRARAGGGAVIDLAPHGLDLAEVVTGQRLTRLTGLLQDHVHDYDVDDGGALLGRFDGGALLVHTVGYNRPETLPRRRLEVTGTAGMLVAENTMGQTAGGTLALIDARTGRREDVGFDVSRSPFTGQLEAFAKTCRGARGPSRTVGDDVRLHRLLERALAGAEPPRRNEPTD